MLLPIQNAVPPPVIAAGAVLTVNIPVTDDTPNVYVIVTTPADTPVIIPLDEPIVAIEGLLLVHTPPGSRLSVRYKLEPVHNVPLDGRNGLSPYDAYDSTRENRMRLKIFFITVSFF